MCAEVKGGGLTARELMSVLGAGYNDFAIMLFRAYIDDSSDERQESVMVAGVLIGTHRQWMKLRKNWNLRLKRDGLDYFRSTEYNSLRGQFFKFRDAVKYPKPKGSQTATAIRDDLDLIIKDSGIIGMSNVIPLEMFRETVARPEIKDRFNPDHFSAAMQAAMRDSVLYVRQNFGDGHLISFICDDSPNADHLLAVYRQFKEKNLWLADTLRGMAHQDDKHTPQLQAADLVASVSRELAMEYLRTGNKVPLKRLEGSFYRMSVWKRETVIQVAGWQ